MVLKNPAAQGAQGFEKPQVRGGNAFEKLRETGCLASENRQTISGARADFDSPLEDRTGLTGTFDIDLDFQPGPFQADSASAYAWFGTALEEQLGLRIERRIEIVDVLVIEALQRPVID